MHIVCNSHGAFDPKLVTNFLHCSLKSSLIPNDDYSALLIFRDKDFKTILDMACGEDSTSNDLLYLYNLSNLQDKSRSYFYQSFLEKDWDEIFGSASDTVEDVLFELDNFNPEYDKVELFEEAFSKLIKHENGHLFFNVAYDKMKQFCIDYNQSLEPTLESHFIITPSGIRINDHLVVPVDTLNNFLSDLKTYTDTHASYVIDYFSKSVLPRHERYQSFISKVQALPNIKTDDYELAAKGISDILSEFYNLFIFVR